MRSSSQPTVGLPDPAVGLLHQARQAHVVVPSNEGPHVTPDLFAFFDGRLWFAVASTTLKAKVLARRPTAGVVVATRGRSVVLTGDVERLDLRDPRRLVTRPTALADGARALVRYGIRNAPDLLAFVGDALSGRLGRRLPPVRVLFSVRPTAAAYVEGDQVRDLVGGWSHLEVDAVPPGGGRPRPGGITAVAGVGEAVGLPGRWYPERRELTVPPALLGLVEAPRRFPVGVVVDDYGAPGPAAKQGTLVRGWGRVTDPGAGIVTVVPERVVDWDGVATSARPAGPVGR